MKKITLSFILLFSLITNAQLNVNNTLYSPADLVLSKLIGQGVSVSNVKYNGSAPNALITNNQLGFYTTGVTPTNLGLSSGLLMTNGSATGAIGPNNASGSTTTSTSPQNGDPDLAMITPLSINNICILEFDFIPLGPEVKFEYVFASEEYPEYVGSTFNDVFGFFLSGPGVSGPFNGAKNIALIPNTTTPISINNVNGGLNSSYYVSNAGGTSIQYDGFTTVLTAKSEVQCGQTYHIKLALADVGDSAFDSAVFFKEGSFSVPRVDLGGDMVGPSKACCGEILHFSTPFNPTNYPGAVHDWYFNGSLIYTSTTSNVFDFINPTCTDGILKVIVKPYPAQNCTFQDEITIQYQYGPVLNVAPPLTLCSDTPATATGSFDLNMQINNIVPGYNSDYEELGFFHTKEDAIANTNVISPATWHNFTGVDNQSIFLGVSNIILTGNVCRSVMEFKLKFVNCDDLVCSPNPSSAVFDLTTRKPIILNGFDPTKYSISFHHDMPSAVAGTAPITPENAYILTSNPEEIYVRYWENAVPLNKQFTQFSLQANQSNIAGADGDLNFCMTDTTVFNLFDYITGEQAGGTWTIVSGSGANVDLTAGTISSNNAPANYVLQYTVSSSVSCPVDFSLLNVNIAAVCGVQTPPDMFLCDDSSNNGIEIFDLSSQNATVLGSLSSTDYTISYHVSSADAISGAFPITPNNAYPNISNPQTIYIRAVKNSDSSVFDTSKSFQLHVVAQPVVTSFTGTTAICIGDSTNLNFVGTPNATITYTDGTTTQPGVLLGATGSATVTVSPTVPTTYSLVSIATTGTPGCTNPASGSVTITVNPINTVTAASSTPTLCENTLLTPITHTTTGATGIGTPTDLPPGVIASWSGNTITITGTPSTAVGSPFNYTIPLTGGCGTVDATGTITVNPDNTVTAASSTPTLCVNTLLTPITHTTTGATGIGTPINLPAGVFASWSGNTITISGTPSTAVGSPFNYSIPLTGGCGVFNATGTITVNPDITVTAASSTPTLCENTVLTPITHTTTGATGIGTPTNLPPGVIASWSGNVVTISGTPSTAVGSPFNYTIPLTGGCGGNATGTITVNPTNTVTAASSTPAICINTVLTPIIHTTTGATGIGTPINLPSGVTASWSGNTITISGTPNTTVGSPFNYTIPLTGGCGTVNATGTITVNPDNTVTAASSAPTLCVNTALTAITHTTTGATGIGTPINLPAGVTASWSGNTITITGTPSTSVGSPFNYSIPLTGGCGTFNAIGTITVIPSNTVTAASSTPTLCVNNLLTPITHTTTGATGIGTPINLPAGVTASWSGNVITISGTPSTTVGSPFNYTIPLTGGCGTVNATGTITVNPAPANISISGGTTICSGGSASLTVTATPGTVITWNGTPSSFTIGLSGSNVIPVSPTINTTYTLTSANLNGCVIPIVAGPTTTTTVNVSATPQFITQIPDITICNGGTLNIASQLTSTVTGATFVWSASTYNVNTIEASSGTIIHNGNQSNIDLIVNLIDPYVGGNVTIQVRPEIGNCSGTPQEIVITVKPIPAILPNQTVADKPVICNNEFVTITTHSNPVATLYTWQVNAATTNGVQIVGGATGGTSTTGILNLQLALTNPLVGGTISFNFTPSNGTCTGATEFNAVTITVNPIPGTPIGLPVDEICSGETTNLTISSFPNIAGTMLVWTVVDYSTGITGFTNGSAPAPFTISDLLVNGSDVQGYVKYSVTSKLGDCNGGTTEYTVLVNPLPKPNLLDGHICVNQDTGVTYQGFVLDTQLSNPDFTYDWYMLNTATNTYDVLASTNGPTHEVTLSGTYQVIVTNTITGCKAAADQAIVTTVYPATDFTYVVTEAFTDNATITVTVNPVGTGNLIYSLDGGAWQSSNVFTGVQAGSHEIMVEDTEGCTSITKTVEVIDYPKYFTPNGDGFNDKWKIVGLTAKHNAKIYIFDRYGKLIKQIDPLGDGWDGKYNGQDIPSTDYWFNVDYIENNQEKQFKAHFSLKR